VWTCISFWEFLTCHPLERLIFGPNSLLDPN
jgi:hypothetical protein